MRLGDSFGNGNVEMYDVRVCGDLGVQIYARVQFYHFSERAGGTFSCDEGDFVSALIEFFTQILFEFRRIL